MADMKEILETLKKEATDYKRTANRQGIKIPDEIAVFLADELETRDYKAFSIPVKELNEACGFGGDLNRSRALTLKKKLNDQQLNLILRYDSDSQWHIGTTANGTRYIISVEQVEV